MAKKLERKKQHAPYCQSCGRCTACQCDCVCPRCRIPEAVMSDTGLCLGCQPEVELELQRQHEADHGPGRM